jgi:hypothetical protein
MSRPPVIAQPLLARARLCREVARASANHEIAQSFEQLAADCIRAAGDVEPDLRASNGLDRVPRTQSTI